MKKSDRLIGYIKYEDKDFPFEFNSETFSVNLYPPTISDRNHLASPQGWIAFRDSSYKHEWIPSKRLEGITAKGYNIVFDVSDACSNIHGFIGYRVHWYFCYSGKLSIDKINGFKLSGDEINYFYKAENALKSEVEFNKDNTIKRFTVSSTEQKTELCGKYRVAKNVDAAIETAAFSTMHFNTPINPIDASSFL